MNTICGANCENCQFKSGCRGCEATCGSPFGGKCAAAEYIKLHGREAYAGFKRGLLEEINALLRARGLPEAAALYELKGSYVDLAYPLPSGESVRFLEGKNIYLGTQVASADGSICCGAVADTDFILLCSYKANGEDPELLVYQKR